MMTDALPGSSSKHVTCCDVRGCLVDSKCNPEASFFFLTKDPIRRQLWLKMMKREDFMDKKEIQDEMKICSAHFSDEDIILSPFRNILKKNADPSRHMPASLTGDASVQAEPCLFEISVQTEPRHRHSHMVCQTGPSLIAELRKKRKLQDEYETVSKRLEMLESGSGKSLMQIFNISCNIFLSDVLAELVKAIINFEDKKYTHAYKVFCLNLYHASPQAYRLMSEDFNLPPISRLKDVKLPMSTEINDDIMATFQIKVQNMTTTQKYCSVAVDIIKLKYNLFYSAKQDKVIGFHEIYGLQSPVPARYAVILAARGILVNWTQPIGFALISATKCRETREEISKWIDKMITKLLEMGLKVKTFICTAKLKLLNEANIRLVTVNKPYFLVNDVKIYYVYDFPHMFRMLRNHFMTHDFHFGRLHKKHVAKYKDLKEFYEKDNKRKLRVADILTDSHMNPTTKEKRNIKYATELLSKAVAAGLDTFINFNVMHENAKDTVEFLVMMNDLHEMLNSSVLSPNTFRGHNAQIEFLTKALQFFESLQLVNTATGQKVTANLLFVKGIQVTINSVQLLFKELQEHHFKHLLTGRLTLSATENIIKRINIKGDKIVEPTSQRFVLKFRQLYFSYVMKSQNEAGISEDMGKAIAQLNEVMKIKSGDKEVLLHYPPTTSKTAGTSYLISGGKTPNTDIAKDCEMDVKELRDMAKIAATVNSYCFVDMLLKKCLEHHNCDMLKYFVNSYEVTYNLVENMNVKQEVTSTAELFDYVARMEDKFREVFDNCRTSLNLVSSVYELFKTDMFLNTYAPCPCFPVEFFQKMFIKVRIYMTLNYNNAVYRRKDNVNKTFIIPGL